ncbi:MAG: class I SAM-dependent methyltransferase [Pseudomonadales bacterium]
MAQEIIKSIDTGLKITMENSIFAKDGTAQGVAKQRLIETLAAADKRVINDPYAAKFVLGAGLIKLMGHRFCVWLGQRLAPGFHEHLIARTRFIDDLIEKTAGDGVEQYVILGAGYDMRGHRLQLPPSLKIFEVDQLEVQTRKRAKLSGDPTCREDVIYVPVDFSDQSLTEQLLAAGFEQDKSNVFTLEGVSQYITKDAVRSTLRELSSMTQNAQSTFILSYVDRLLNDDPKACFGRGYPNAEKRAKMIRDSSASVGEPWISFYSADEIQNLLSEEGYSVTQDITVEDLNALYFSPVGRALRENELFKLEHFVVATKH